jgi:hypothetical protein
MLRICKNVVKHKIHNSLNHESAGENSEQCSTSSITTSPISWVNFIDESSEQSKKDVLIW